MINNVNLIGRLTWDVEVQQGKNGKDYAYLRIAVNQKSKDKDADFIDCVAFEKQAGHIAKYTHKGSMIAIQGKIKSKKDKDGKNSMKVWINEVEFLDKKPKDIQPQPKQEAPQPLEQVSYAQPTYHPQQQPMQQQPMQQQNSGWMPQQEPQQYTQNNLNDNNLPFL